MTTLVTPAAPPAPTPPRRAARWWVAWLAPLAAAVFTVCFLDFYGVPMRTTARFVLYVGGGVLLPGMLLWRYLQGRSGRLVSDAAAGLALGYACEVLTYIATRSAGLPRLAPAWAVITLVAFAAVPGLRRYWRGQGPGERTPPVWSAVLCAAALVLVWWSGVAFFRAHDLTEPGMRAPDGDSMFHLALIGEARHHMPIMSPWLPDQPLLYHWFAYADIAATSWGTGIEPQVLLLRLSPLPMVFGLLALIAVLGTRLTGRWWAGAAAALVAWFALTPTPYPWRLHGWFSTFATNAYEDGSLLRAQMWTSPTQTFGAVLFAGLALALVELLTAPTARRWIAVVLLMAAVTGGKATFLPMLLGGLLLVAAVELLRRRRPHRTALAAAALTLAAIAVAQLVLFRGAVQGMAIQPLHFARISGAPYTAGFATPDAGPAWRLLLVAGITLLCWACIWPGLAALHRLHTDRRVLAEPVVMMLGIGLAGVAALAVFGHDGGAEGWFMVSGRPYLTLAAVAGIVLITPAAVPARRLVTAAVIAAAAGGLAVLILRGQLSRHVPRPASTGGPLWSAWALLWPYLAVAALVGLLVLGMRLADLPGKRALCAAFLAGMCAATSVVHLYHWTRDATRTGWRGAVLAPIYIPHGTGTAGRWLREHSEPGDLVATNAHCLLLPGTPPDTCDNRHFAFAAYTERRFLIEAWGFTDRTHRAGQQAGVNFVYAPYWDPAKLADNDTAFSNPTRERLERLAHHYGVRWLMVDESYGTVSPRLGDYATFRFRAGTIAVYQLTDR
ncbi:hypothetical protein KZZ52_44645 [Dactylosporangium sp. AC04546]|uniref:hypothetical protein n=1 Tax=Dactylosporangium sp. AC04546 TaxID=2862460 RepID=UPI001EE0F93C|nr:hypothetical protein [Dactylosporangium sp. AC04546]WVK81005.1 hypothetical protein KZZ52_44645 [Dactylosporangium sp. AC04546]